MKSEFALCIIIGLIYLSLGFLLLHYEQIGYGISFFVCLPFIIGYILGNSTVKSVSLWGHFISLIIFFTLLFLGGLEGMVCILTAMPLIVLAIALGASVKYFIKTFSESNKPKPIIKSSIMPFLLFVVLGFSENELNKNDENIIEIRSEIILPYTTMEVYETIKSVDTLNVKNHF